jgi:nucleotide-binding universal stress UspA family protein
MARIIVGVDGSDSARNAVRWAVEHAAGGDELVLAKAWNLQAVGAFEAPYLNISDFETQAHQVVADLVAFVADEVEAAQVDVTTVVEHGHPGQVLIDLSDGADHLVVGSRGFGGFKGLLLGSVSTYVVHHARCPVTVVPPPRD